MLNDYVGTYTGNMMGNTHHPAKNDQNCKKKTTVKTVNSLKTAFMGHFK